MAGGNNADFLVTVGADIDAYLKSMGTADKTAEKTSKSIVKSLAEAAAASSKMGGSVAKGSNQAGAALTDLSRIAQDAPFGFIAIQNNINPLLESFGRLKSETGSTGAALKALAGGLIGGGGLGLAISVATSAITLFTMWQQRSKKATDENKGAVDGYAKALSDASKSAGEEIAKADTLYRSATNLNLPLDERLNIVRKLKTEYPDYFKGLSDEAILAGKAEEAYKKLNQAIIGKAAIQAASEQLSQAMKPLVDNAIKQASVNAGRDKVDVRKVMKNLQKDVDKNPLIIPIDSFKFDRTGKVDNAGPIFNPLVERLENEQDALRDAEVQVKKWQDVLQRLVKDFGSNTIAGGQKADATKTLLQEYEEQLKKLVDEEQRWIDQGNKADFFNLTKRERQINALMSKIEMLKNAQEKLNQPPSGSPLSTISINTDLSTKQFDGIVKGMKAYAALKQRQTELKMVTDASTKAFLQQQATVSSFTNIFGSGLTQAFQSALSGTQNFVSAMGSFLGQLISRLIAAAAAAALLALVLSAVGFGPGLSGAASTFGSFKNLFSGFSGVALADGGITTGPTNALIGEGREKEAVMPLSKLQSFVNTNQGGTKWEVSGVLRGPDLLLMTRRAEESQRRGA